MEQQHDKRLDDSFKNSFEGFEIEPSEKVWIGISDQLDRSHAIKHKIILARWAVAASVVLCLFSTVIYFMKKPAFNDQELALTGNPGLKDNWNKSTPIILELPKYQRAYKQSTAISDTKTTKAPQTFEKSGKRINTLVQKNESVEPHEEKLAIVNPLPSNRVVQFEGLSLDSSPKIEHSILKTAMLHSANEHLIDDEAAPILDISAALNYVASKVDKRDKRFLAISKKKGFSLNLGILKVEKKVNYIEEEE
ncbi:hypothetical protein [Solitalea koreensis]|uniref:Uncharacterized protein n=1 Tax=Solitalea koreensis TaxID=543615 RepID=A0A521ABG2_9SPHI|nr:hypothetical protein [Solitalea koreensis]SMO32112.1 hypothetical protein SAMN06265350_10133 [Solitalea koreensis]